MNFSAQPLTPAELEAIREAIDMAWEHAAEYSGMKKDGTLNSIEWQTMLDRASDAVDRLPALFAHLQAELDCAEDRLYDARHDAAREAAEKRDGG